MFDLNEIKLRCTSKSYQLGQDLYFSGKVSRLSVTVDRASAIVSGRDDYHVSLQKDASIQGETLQVSCSCLAATYQDICKHAVAVALLVENTPEKERVNEDIKQDQLKDWFKQKSVDELTDILMTYIDESTNEQDKWQLLMRSEENHLGTSELSKLIDQALPAKDVWEWEQVQDYFAHANEMFATLFELIEKLPVTEQWQLIVKAIQRLNKVLEQIHDSGDFCFYIGDGLNQRLIALFNLLPWSAEKKALWIFSHTEEHQYDLFPIVPEDFELSPEVKQIFLAQCLKTLEQKAPLSDLNDWKHKSSMQRLTRPLIGDAKQTGDWQAQCQLMKMTAIKLNDYLAIGDVCLDNGEALQAEYWLQQAYQLAKSAYEKEQCQAYEVKVRVALNEYKSAWQLAWQLFSENPSFMAYKKLQALEQKIGVIDSQFIAKSEHILAHCYVETERGLVANGDALLDFYIDRKELEKARVWALAHKANTNSLLKIANLIIAPHSDDGIALYRRVVGSIIEQTNNSAYQEATDLLVKLEQMLKINNTQLRTFYQMVKQVGQAYKQKRNMLKLLKEHFPGCF